MASSVIQCRDALQETTVTNMGGATGSVHYLRRGNTVTAVIDFSAMDTGVISIPHPTWATPAINLYEKWWQEGGGNLYLYGYHNKTVFNLSHSANNAISKTFTYVAKE